MTHNVYGYYRAELGEIRLPGRVNKSGR